MININTIIYNEDLSVASKTEQPIRAFAEQANTIEIKVPVSSYNTAFIIYQGLVSGVVNPRLRATERLFMTPMSDDGIYSRWHSTVPGSILNDMSLMKCTGVRVLVEFWHIDGDCLGIEKYNTEVTFTIQAALEADYPDATDGQWVRVIDTDSDWYYDLDTTSWIDYEDKHLVGIVKAPTAASDFGLEKGIYTDEPSHEPTNTELILEELAKMFRYDGSRSMTGDLDMDGNGLDNVGSLTLYNVAGNVVITTDGTKVTVNIGGVDYYYAIKNADNIFSELNTFVKQVTAQAGIEMSATKITGLAAGTLDNDAIRKKQLDDGLLLKEDLTNKVTSVVVTATDGEYVSAKALYEKFLTKVATSFTIAGLDLTGEAITLLALKTAIGEATTLDNGLLSASDKTLIDVLRASYSDDDGNDLVNTIKEVLAAFADFPETTDLMAYFATKVDKVEGKELSENDLTDILKTSYDLAVTHANTTDGTNPHATTYANVASKPTTFEGFGLANGTVETIEATTSVTTPKVILANGVYIEYNETDDSIDFVFPE